MKTRPSEIRWAEMPAWRFRLIGDAFVLKVAETTLDTFVVETKRDRNVTFYVHATDANRLIGYSLVVNEASNDRPDFAIGLHYLGFFYSRLRDLQQREGRTMSVIYHDQSVRFIAFGDKPATRDYLLVMRNRVG